MSEPAVLVNPSHRSHLYQHHLAQAVKSQFSAMGQPRVLHVLQLAITHTPAKSCWDSDPAWHRRSQQVQTVACLEGLTVLATLALRSLQQCLHLLDANFQRGLVLHPGYCHWLLATMNSRTTMRSAFQSYVAQAASHAAAREGLQRLHKATQQFQQCMCLGQADSQAIIRCHMSLMTHSLATVCFCHSSPLSDIHLPHMHAPGGRPWTTCQPCSPLHVACAAPSRHSSCSVRSCAMALSSTLLLPSIGGVWTNYTIYNRTSRADLDELASLARLCPPSAQLLPCLSPPPAALCGDRTTPQPHKLLSAGMSPPGGLYP